jgi:mannobiose 2-epimerase
MESEALALAGQLHDELTRNILPFWANRMVDADRGGFHGRMDGMDNLIPDAPRGGILNARILWTFAAAHRLLGSAEYLRVARWAKDYIFKHFFDAQLGGTYWSLTAEGYPLDTKKQIYSQAFFIYALSEYFMATGDEECRAEAIHLFRLIEKHSFDKAGNGYFEAFDRAWKPLADMRLSDRDANEKKTMNTHLHILEAYTNLYRIWRHPDLASQLRNLIYIFIERIIDPQTHHLNLFFDEAWRCKSSVVSYGHDVECSWLLHEAALELGDNELTTRVERVCMDIVNASLEGLQPDGSIIYERNLATGHIDYDRHWWPQAEQVVGMFNAYQLTGDAHFLSKSVDAFRFICENLIDPEHGEWFWSLRGNGLANRADDKAGFWKCPYHNGRMCIEIIKRTGSQGKSS